MELYFVRHGRTAGNTEQRYIGRTDEPILPESREELKLWASQGKYGRPMIVFTSPMKRCRKTAEIIYPDIEQYVIEDFRECDFGAFEGKNYLELEGDSDYQAWIDSGGTLPFPGGESMDVMKERALRGFFKAMDIADGLDAAFVVHGGTIMAILSQIDGGDFYDYQIANGECISFTLMTDAY